MLLPEMMPWIFRCNANTVRVLDIKSMDAEIATEGKNDIFWSSTFFRGGNPKVQKWTLTARFNVSPEYRNGEKSDLRKNTMES